MSNDVASPATKSQARLPWRLFLFFLTVFAAASFDPLLSVDYVARRDATVEERLQASVERTEAGNLRRRIVLASLGIVAAVSLYSRRQHNLGVNGILGILVVFFLFWVALSILWSHDQGLTFRRVILLAMLCLGALAAAERLSFRDITYFAFVVGCIVLVAGLVCELALGTFKPWDPEYRFVGVMNPIFLGAHLGMMVIAALTLAQTSGPNRRFYYAAALLAFFFMLLTRSRGPSGATLCALVVFWLLLSPRSRKVVILLLVPAVVMLAFPGEDGRLFTRTEDALLFGRSVERGYEMQGRDALWRECIEYSARRPVLGYGYDAFWTRGFTFTVTDISGFTSQHTHNAFLDLLLGVGIPGAVTYVLIILLAMKMLLSLHMRFRSIYYVSALAFLVLYMLHNLFVSVHLAAQLQTFIVLVIIAKLSFVVAAPDRLETENDEHVIVLDAPSDRHVESVDAA